jgi:hypothetical protein
MKLPAADRAFIDTAKLRHYLLSSSHPVGRFKARFFARLGYVPETWRQLRADLKALARSGDATAGKASEYGAKYEVRGILKGPNGRSAQVAMVWIILTGEDLPRLVTVHPGGKR